ncbi:MAG TPA: transglutaminase-like domain-containing protein [Gemmataceae bacterium]|nr:transglutaminase-like domain-containing protein [Gemmataceae bacterium]
MKYKARLWLTLVLLFVPLAGWAQEKLARLPVSEKDVQRLLRTDFYGVYFLGKKVGWAKNACARVERGPEAVYVNTEEFSFKLLVLGRKTEMRQLETFEFAAQPPYALRSARSRESDGQTAKEITLSRNGQVFEALIEAGGEKTRKRVGALDYTLADLACVPVWIRRGPKLGESVTIRNFSLDDLKIHPEVHKLTATKRTKTQGVTVTYHELEVTRPDECIKSVERYDESADQVLSEVVRNLEFRVEPEKLAKNTEFSADLFELGKVRLNKELGKSDHLTSLVVETLGKDDLRIKSGPRQSVTRNPSGTYTIKLGKAYGTPTRPTPRELEDAQSETPDYPISNPKIRALAQQAVGDAATPRAKVERLVAFVHNYITPSYSARPLTVLDLLKVRKGDCSNYAALFTALARAAGIPARELGGLVYMGDDEKAFGFHAWNEVVLDGQWVPIDATSGETDLKPTHISYGSITGEQSANFFESFGKLSLRLLEAK